MNSAKSQNADNASITRRDMIKNSALALAAGTIVGPVLWRPAATNAAGTGREITLEPKYYPRHNFRPEIDLEGKLAVITGASRGNGRAVAEALSNLGVSVIGTSRNPGSVPDPTPFPLLPLDITDVGSILAFRAALVSHPAFQQRGHVDILVNNAARMVVGQIVPMPPTDFGFYLAQRDLGIRTTYSGHVTMTNSMLPLLPQSGYARIVFMASIGAYYTGGGVPGASMLDIYFSGKAALRAYANNLDAALRAGGSSIRVSTVNPYVMNTTLAEHPNPIYTEPVGPGGLSDTDQIFNSGITQLRQLIANGLPTAMVGETYAQLLQMIEPKQNVLVGSPREPFSTKGANQLHESAILADNAVSPIPFR